jgi:hypothetical protein
VSGGGRKRFDPDARVVAMDEWRLNYLIGQCMLEEAKRDPEVKARLHAILDAELTDPADRALFGLPRTPPEKEG